MADRHTLHISKLEAFKEWLEKDGWTIEETKGVWEALRARKSDRSHPLIVYLKLDAKEHLSIMDRDMGVVKAFLRDEKKTKTNADRIRSMSDEELAIIMSELVLKALNFYCDAETLENIDFKRDVEIDMKLEWLQSEVQKE